MTLELTAQAEAEIWLEAEQQHPTVTSIDRLETIRTIPAPLGSGYEREIDLCEGLELSIFHAAYRDQTVEVSENPHLVQFKVHLSGVNSGSNQVLLNARQGYIGGSGMQRRFKATLHEDQPHVGVDIHMEPDLLSQLFAEPTGELPAELQPLVRGDDWQQVFSPKTTRAMRSVAQQIIDCPFMGVTKRLYLQGKVFELMALQIDGIADKATVGASLKPETIARIHQAAEILRSRLEQPPSQTELAQQMNMSDRTLQKGFRAVFGVTPFAYLTQQRMSYAQRLLRASNRTVAEVANLVGYANPAQFASAFKRQFGLSPSECLSQK